MATDFFAAQDAARARTRHLVVLFLASVAGLIGAIYLAVIAFVVGGGGDYGWWDPAVFQIVAGATVLVVGGASIGKILSLRAGGGTVARSVGGRLLDPATIDTLEQRLRNVVEEMAIASGVPVPEIYILDHERGINAFAAGFTPDDAAVAVTRGCLERLNRDELQGVIAHEFSHILNGDMRLNIHLIGLVYGLLVLSIIGQGILRMSVRSSGRSSRSDRKGGGVFALIALGLILLCAGWIGVLFGRLLQSAVSRQREFLADASAVQFTRNPDGLAGALRKIGARGSRVRHEHSQDVAHLFFANGLALSWAGLFATHPPIEERIRALDPSWDGTFDTNPPPLPGEAESPPAEGVSSLAESAAPVPENLAQAQVVLADLSGLFGDEWRDPAAARDLVTALLPPLPGAAEPSGVRRYRERLAEVPADRRLALVGMLLPALGQLPAADRADLLAHLDRVARECGLDAFGFGVWWIVRRHLVRRDKPAADRTPLLADPAIFADDVSVLIAALLRADTAPEAAAAAFTEAMAASPSFAPLCRLPEAPADAARLEQALAHLATATFALRGEVIAAASHAVLRDGRVTGSEDALMQVFSQALDCPAPLQVAA
jgi:Zn-dependent protease with chaperone function